MTKENICQICGKENPEESHFFREHKIKLSDYFIKTFNKKDLLTEEPIPFISKDQYILNSFLSKSNFQTYIELYNDKARSLLEQSLLKLITYKQYKYIPTQFESRSWSSLPSIKTFNKFFSVNEFCKNLGLDSRGFTIDQRDTKYINISPDKELLDFEILIDTREQTKLPIAKYQLKKLDYGDYTLDKPNYRFYIERKSINDAIATFTSGLERFEREIERAQADNKYLVILIEIKLSDLLNFKEKNLVPRTKIGPDYVFHNIRYLMAKYNNIQFLAVRDRDEATILVKKILYSKTPIDTFDLQLAYDNYSFGGGGI